MHGPVVQKKGEIRKEERKKIPILLLGRFFVIQMGLFGVKWHVNKHIYSLISRNNELLISGLFKRTGPAFIRNGLEFI